MADGGGRSDVGTKRWGTTALYGAGSFRIEHASSAHVRERKTVSSWQAASAGCSSARPSTTCAGCPPRSGVSLAACSGVRLRLSPLKLWFGLIGAPWHRALRSSSVLMTRLLRARPARRCTAHTVLCVNSGGWPFARLACASLAPRHGRSLSALGAHSCPEGPSYLLLSSHFRRLPRVSHRCQRRLPDLGCTLRSSLCSLALAIVLEHLRQFSVARLPS
ncbi:hypothetical protein C8Q79DRAFT_533943 [Trametes meyenii]|nr:hypothetical protein C8Q79DRAFT_533943 [Trametes meyenii]